MLRRTFLFSMAALVGLKGATAMPTSNATTLSPKLLVNGDSIAYAVRPGVTLEQSAFHQIAQARGLELVNKAVPGDTTAQMKAHWAADLAEHTPSATAIMMSANDSAHGITPAQGRQNMLDMIDMAQATGASVTIYMHTPFFHDGGTWLHGAGKQVYSYMKELGGMPGVQFVDAFDCFCRHLFYSGYNGTLPSGSNPVMIPLFAPDANGLPDWIHPSAFAQSLFVEPTLMNPRACAPAG